MRSYATTTRHSGAAGSWREGENDGARRKVEKGGEIRNAQVQGVKNFGYCCVFVWCRCVFIVGLGGVSPD